MLQISMNFCRPLYIVAVIQVYANITTLKKFFLWNEWNTIISFDLFICGHKMYSRATHYSRDITLEEKLIFSL